jgi:hypothetical protein
MTEALHVRRQRDAIDRVRMALATRAQPRPLDVEMVLHLLEEALTELGLRRLVDLQQIVVSARDD